MPVDHAARGESTRLSRRTRRRFLERSGLEPSLRVSSSACLDTYPRASLALHRSGKPSSDSLRGLDALYQLLQVLARLIRANPRHRVTGRETEVDQNTELRTKARLAQHYRSYCHRTPKGQRTDNDSGIYVTKATPVQKAARITTSEMPGLDDDGDLNAWLRPHSPPDTKCYQIWKKFLWNLRDDKIEQICIITSVEDLVDIRERMSAPAQVDEQLLCSSSTEDADVTSGPTKVERFAAQSWETLKKSSPFYDVLREYADVFPDEVPCELPHGKGTRHEIDLAPGTKYCVTRQWPLPRDQVNAIDEFFDAHLKAGHVRESTSPHASPTFCVKKATGGWRIVHAFNKLNAATTPVQTPIPRKGVIIDSMQGSTIFSTIDLRDGFYQILMREKDIPLAAVSTPSGMLWEWLVMPQGLTNAPATFNRCVTQLLRPVRDFAPSYFDDVFIHSRASDAASDVEVHREHLRQLLDLMRKHKLYANIQKCMFGVDEIPVLGCFIGKNGVRPDPEKIKAISDWPVPTSQKDLRKFLGLATYLHKYSQNYAGIIRPLSSLLKKDVDWK
ncbi:reverse transcriptase, partial [Globisporangium splendens]